MADDNKTHALIELIYDTALNPNQWPELLNAVAEILEGGRPFDEQPVLDHPRNGLSRALQGVPATLKHASFNHHDDTELSQTLSRHFLRALHVAKRLYDLEEHNQKLSAFLDNLPIGVILTNDQGEIVDCNHQAKLIAESTSPLSLRDNKLHLNDKKQAKQLFRSMERLANAITSDLESDVENSWIVKAQHETDDIFVVLSPVWQADIRAATPLFALFISQRKSQPVKLPSALVKLYGLTEKEQAIAEELIQGYSAVNIANNNHITENTARTHIKSLMAKTQTSRQAELVSLLLTGPASTLQLLKSTDIKDNISDSNAIAQTVQGVLQLTLNDERTMAYQELGAPNGIPLIMVHSSLGSRKELPFNANEIAIKMGFRLIIPDRPGVGYSSPRPDHNFDNYADDLQQLIEHLNLDRVCLSGYALGGAFALRSAQKLAPKVLHLTLVGTGTGLKTREDFEQTIPLYRLNLRMARDLPAVHKAMVAITRKSILNNPQVFLNLLGGKLSETDATPFKHPLFRQLYYAALSECARQGPDTHARELNLFMHDWGFAPEDTHCPVDVWHGKDDVHVPLTTGQRLADKIPTARKHYLENQGHFLFYSHFHEILSAIKERLGS